jgi:hypothetical protein
MPISGHIVFAAVIGKEPENRVKGKGYGAKEVL